MTIAKEIAVSESRREVKALAHYVTRLAPLAPQENYVVGIDRKAFARRTRKADIPIMVGIVLGPLASVMDIGWGVAAITGHTGAGDVVFGIVSASTTAVSAATIGAGALLHRVPRLAKRHAWADLCYWLNERYGIQPSKDSRKGLLTQIFGQKWEENSYTPFEDDAGKKFRLHYSSRGHWVEEVEVPDYTPKDYAPAGTVASLTPTGVNEQQLVDTLPLEASMAYKRGQDLLSIANGRSLSIESEHVIKRVETDFQQLLTLNSQLRQLGELSQEDLQALAKAMAGLNAELASVVASERVSLSKTLHAQVEYIQNRSLTPSGLALPPASSDVEALTVADAED